MTDVELKPDSHNIRGWIVSFVFLILGVVYISSFAGNIASLLPAPCDRWHHIPYFLLEPWWRTHIFTEMTLNKSLFLLHVAVCFAMGLIVPAILWLLGRRKLRDVGIGLPNILGLRLIVVSVIISIPFGLWLLCTGPYRSAPLKADLVYIWLLLSMIPEHFLICGTFTALMLPGRKLPKLVPMAPIKGSIIVRILRWVGLAQSRPSPQHNRVLAWFGLTGVSLFAICVSGALFGMVHVGKDWLELLLSFPGGVAVAYVTLRSYSIWPAIIAHWTMNLIPFGILVLFR